ncbi:sugar transferase [Bacillus sp. S70]|nr:sugar transferase [Bacillus sp. S29]MBK0102099.1 sugar transferase [Bacillus sp. S70]MBK0107453.1 sugar transferase [Bacillus sp. S73]MBK0136363.1 sugar transferase [Bacillus sp. S72]MBK0148912.1 sugar transferase [Bacillus sp. S74]MBK0159413.1 sugar transferase [Bacillus sp. S71]
MYTKYIKRFLDILFALLLLPIILIVTLVCAVCIKIEDGGPIFYFGERLGRNKVTFKMFKLRSMKVNAPDLRNEDGSTFNSEDDPRLTRIGKMLRKTSLDELPQLFNVLKGDMSFIGPRPDLPEHLNYYDEEEGRKLDVLPGISGYNQAYYRNSTEWKQRLKHDVYYVDNISFILDLKIGFKTVTGIVMRKGIYSNVGDVNVKRENK